MQVVETPLGVRLPTCIPHWPHPPQEAFLWLNKLEALYGGAAGGGKSDALLMAALQYVDVPGYAALILRKTFADLNLPGAIMDRSKTWLAGSAAKWNDNEKQWRFPSGSTVTFGYLQTANDKFRYQGAEFQMIGFDELTQFDEADYAYLLSRLRRPSDGVLSLVPLRMRAASNPGGRGHKWVKRRFIDRLPNPDDPEDTPVKARQRVFVPARLDDNPSVDQAAYASALAGLDPQTRLQLLNGDWDARQPGPWVFPEGLDEVFALGATHRQERFAGKLRPPVGDHLVLSADWGVHSHLLLGWPLEAGGMHVAAEVVYNGTSVRSIAPTAADKATDLGFPVGRQPYDASMPGLNDAFLERFNELVDRPARYQRVPFNKFKMLTVDYLQFLVRGTAAGEVAPVLSIDEKACPVLAEQLRGWQFAKPANGKDPETGRIEKGDDHGPDSLVAMCAQDASKRRDVYRA